MSEKRLGVLVHGAGWVSRQYIKVFESNSHTEVVAICSRRLESCKLRAKKAGLKDVYLCTNYEEALRHEGVDIVSICTPQHLHSENTIAAAEAGKHIVIEKPIANSLKEMREMRDAVRKAKVKTIVGFVLRWSPLSKMLKRIVAEDMLGEVYFVEADYQSHISSWWSGYEVGRKEDTGVSAFLVAGIHAIDAIRWFAGRGRYETAQPVEVFAYSGGYRKNFDREYDFDIGIWRKGVGPLEYDGLEVALVKFDGGTLAKVSVNFDCIMPYTFPIKIFGDKGTVKNNRIWSHKFAGQKDWIEIPTILPDTVDVTHHPFQEEIDHFVECILGEKESHCNLEDAILSHEIAFAALQCYETKRPVKLPLL